mmetsp:Transcript_8354/g.17883  ORF Transcript_8354/g.17883 Transcript_8354/m.17883 type:complete len:222 (-) Transcript_8354:1357-2022(-)
MTRTRPGPPSSSSATWRSRRAVMRLRHLMSWCCCWSCCGHQTGSWTTPPARLSCQSTGRRAAWPQPPQRRRRPPPRPLPLMVTAMTPAWQLLLLPQAPAGFRHGGAWHGTTWHWPRPSLTPSSAGRCTCSKTHSPSSSSISCGTCPAPSPPQVPTVLPPPTATAAAAAATACCSMKQQLGSTSLISQSPRRVMPPSSAPRLTWRTFCPASKRPASSRRSCC